VRVTTCEIAAPAQASPSSGPLGVRARVGFRPTSPQVAAGMRIEPPPSLACAAGTMPEATAAAAPPLEPPGLKAVFQGLAVAPNRADWVVEVMPNSGVVVVPRIIRPAAS